MLIYFKTIPKGLNIILLISVLIMFLKIFLLNRISQPIQGMHELGLVFEGILASIIASYIFYLIIIHFKDISDKAIVYPHITKWAKQITADCKSELVAFSNKTFVDLPFEQLTQTAINRAFEKINPYDEAPAVSLQGAKLNWLQFMLHSKLRFKENISNLYSQLTYLEPALVSHLSNIDSCDHFKTIETLTKLKLSNTSLESFAKMYFEYCSLCKSLEDYLNRHPLHENFG